MQDPFSNPSNNPGRQPSRPNNLPNNQPQNLKSNAAGNENLTAWQRFSRANDASLNNPGDQNHVGVTLSRIDPRKRIVALILDCIACTLASIFLTTLPLINRFISLRMAALLFFLIKDYLFQGRGIGKNLMGLQVVDRRTGAPASLQQSVLRNIVLLAPFAVLEILNTAFAFVSINWLSDLAFNIFNVIGMIYIAIVLPMECYRAYYRDDSLRKGDEVAQTCVVEAPMDFSHPFSQ